MATLKDWNNPFGRLTAASTLRGSIVFNLALEELGRIEDVIIEEPAGRIAFAIVHRGGFLGIGAHHYPLQWVKLRFDVEMDGYIVDVDKKVQERESPYTGRRLHHGDDAD